MKNAIYISIKGIHLRKIETGEKNYEFRNYVPKEKISTLYVYETYPCCELKYIIEIGNIVKYPSKIKKSGNRNKEFNEGLLTKYAYEIDNVYKLENPIKLKILKEKYNFTPPQSYAYSYTYKELSNKLIKMNKIKII